MPHKVLLIDDSALTLEAATVVLEGAGYDVRAAREVAEFSQVLGTWRPDVILADVHMPSMSGVELCRLLKSQYETAHVPVVLYSAAPPDELARMARECEADGFLSKMRGVESLPDELQLVIDTALF
ncbi:MAG: response regulator [Deltaproteobacteria bacterium]|nr:response regulator [Deltaproteobacteria bacterium]